MFRGLEVLTFAVEIEKNGRLFYQTVAQFVEDEKAKDLFQSLALEEEKHISDFEKLMADVSNYSPRETYEGEYFEYIKSLVDNHVFRKNTDVKDLAQKVTDAKSAIDLALHFEKDSIVFFNELRRSLSGNDQITVDNLIAEEKKHIQTLTELKKQY